MPTGRSPSCSPTRWALDWNYTHPSRDHGRDRRGDADLRRRLLRRARRAGLGAVAVQREGAAKARRSCTSTASCAARASSCVTEYVPTDEKTGPRFPLLLTTGRILSQYNVGAQTRRTENVRLARGGPARDPSARRREPRHQATATGSGSPAAPARRRCARRSPTGSRRAWSTPPSTIPTTQANVVTTDYSDWATNCPEYKVTAVQVGPSNGPTRLAGRVQRAGAQEPPHRGPAGGGGVGMRAAPPPPRFGGSPSPRGWSSTPARMPMSAATLRCRRHPDPPLRSGGGGPPKAVEGASCAPHHDPPAPHPDHPPRPPRLGHGSIGAHGAGGDADRALLRRHDACRDDGLARRLRRFRARLLADRRHHRFAR